MHYVGASNGFWARARAKQAAQKRNRHRTDQSGIPPMRNWSDVPARRTHASTSAPRRNIAEANASLRKVALRTQHRSFT
jgi:hypothetical protein